MQILAAVAAGCAIPYVLHRLFKPKRKLGWVLEIRVKFQCTDDLEQFVRIWSPAARFCHRHEPELLSYEVCKSDKDPLQILVFERYSSKAAYTGPHRRTQAFSDFKDAIGRSGLSDRYIMDGHSYKETGVGFMSRTENYQPWASYLSV